MKPCKQPCPKCGSVDIYRMHHKPGDLDLSFDAGETNRENEFVSIKGWLNARVKQECIMHHCRCCQYEWESAPLNGGAK